jgi:hypothetical protein
VIMESLHRELLVHEIMHQPSDLEHSGLRATGSRYVHGVQSLGGAQEKGSGPSDLAPRSDGRWIQKEVRGV